MKIMFLSRVPFQIFRNYLLDENDEIYVVTDQRFSKEYEKHLLKNVYAFDHYLENHKLVDFSIELIKSENIESLIVIDEADMERGALIRELSGLYGQSENCANRYRDKLIMKDTLKEHIKMPEYFNLRSEIDIENFATIHGYPVVLKHRKSWATNNTLKINDKDELCKLTEKINKIEEYIVEEWIDAKMYTVEGIQHNGALKWFAIHEYDRNCLESVAGDDGFTTLTSRLMNNEDERKRIKQYTEKILNLLNKSNKFTSAIHLEFFITKDNVLLFNEIGSRVGGGQTIDLLKIAYNVDITELLINQFKSDVMNENMKYPFVTRPKHFVGAYRKYYVNKKEELNQLHINHNWIVDIHKNKVKNSYQPTININNYEAMIVIKEENYDRLTERLLELKEY
ncbi:MAG: ATP-grasp domain-containing protein [Bacillota bacterium]